MARQIFLFSKLFVVTLLFAMFLNYFGLNSLKRYQEKKVFVTSTQKLEEFIPAPAITICPMNSFPGLPEEEMMNHLILSKLILIRKLSTLESLESLQSEFSPLFTDPDKSV